MTHTFLDALLSQEGAFVLTGLLFSKRHLNISVAGLRAVCLVKPTTNSEHRAEARLDAGRAAALSARRKSGAA